LNCYLSISNHFQKYLAKGKDLHGATKSIEMLQPTAIDLKGQMHDFGEQLEDLHEKIEGASRLHHLFGLKLKDDDVHHEMQKLADRIGVPELIERCKHIIASNNSINSCKKEIALENLEFKIEKITATSTPDKMKIPPQPPTANSHLEFTKYSNKPPTACNCWQDSETQKAPVISLPPLIEDIDPEVVKMQKLKLTDEDEEDHSKMADSGLGGCDRCEGNGKLTRACSCQSFEDATIACDKRYVFLFFVTKACPNEDS
jgi:pleckstrin homology domain-containing family G member 4